MNVAGPLWRWARGLSPFAQDAALALALLLATVAEIRFQGDLGLGEPWPPALWPMLAVAMIAPLAWRRSHPLTVVAVQTAVEAVAVPVSMHIGFSGVMMISLLIGAYSAGAHSERRAWSLALIVVAGVLPGVALGLTRYMGGAFPGFNAVFWLTAWLIGHSIRVHRRQVADLEERARRLEREADATARVAVAEERARVARELHDVVAHGVAVMVVQAEAARRMLRRHPEQAEAALRTVSSTGSEALSELQHVLGVLAGETGRPELEPAPGLRDLDSLVGRLEAAGLLVDLRLEGDARPLSRGLDLTVYRIVQEALTNVLKHAGTSHAAVGLRYAGDDLRIEVTDKGRGPAPPNGAGRGLVGMRERVAAFGGELETGPRTGGGFAVRVRLPLEASA